MSLTVIDKNDKSSIPALVIRFPFLTLTWSHDVISRIFLMQRWWSTS